MVKLKSTSDKDLFVQVLDILEIQGIKTRHTQEFDDFEGEEGVLVYSVFVDEKDLEKANALLAEYTIAEIKPEEIEYSEADEAKLLDELVYNVKNEQQRENILDELTKQGVDEETIKQKIKEEIKVGYTQEHLTDFKKIMFNKDLWFVIGMYSSKKKHPITKELFYEYDDESRRAALILIIYYAFIFSFAAFYMIYFSFIA
jgi:hypothetical protein